MKITKKNNKSKFSTISLPTQLVKKIKEKIKGTGIHSPSAYVTFILREILAENSKTKEETTIKQRLKNLGYLD